MPKSEGGIEPHVGAENICENITEALQPTEALYNESPVLKA
jgi:hypothetical protein